MSRYTVTFQGSDFEDRVAGLKIIGVDTFRNPTRKLTSQTIARTDLSTVSSDFYTDKKINVRAEIGATNRATLEASIDTLKSLIQTREGALVVPQGALSRQYTATLSNLGIAEAEGGFTTVDMEFFCSDPFGYDVAATTLYNYANLVGGLYDFKCTFAGTAETQKPIITITINTVSANTDGNISIMNQTKGQSLEINRDWIAGDVLIVDTNSNDHPVQVNGADVDFEGAIPDWDLGVGNVTYTDSFTARNIALTIAYNKRYL